MKKNQPSGLSLLELVLTILLMSILAAGTAYYATDAIDAKKYEETRIKLETIGRAMVGDLAVSNEGAKTNFGYHGDMGRLPANIGELTTLGAQAAWVYDSTYGIGTGWKGPYIAQNFTGRQDLTKDEWGRTWVIDTGASPATVTSYARDGSAGGASYDQDLVLQLAAGVRFSTVSGMLLDGNSVVKNKTITVAYPTNGAISTVNATSDATTGSYSFSNVPLGIRAFKVTGTNQTLGYKSLAVDRPQFFIPNGFLNFSADLQKVFTSSAVTTASGTSQIWVNIDSTYEVDVDLDYVTCNWDGNVGAYLDTVYLDGTTVAFSTCLNNGQRGGQLSALPLTALDTGVSFRLNFTTLNCSTAFNISSGTNITCKLEWDVTTTNPDTITIITP